MRAVKGTGKDLIERALAEKADLLDAPERQGLPRQVRQFMAYHEEVFTTPLYRDLSGVRDLAVIRAELREEREARERLHEALNHKLKDMGEEEKARAK